MSAKEILDFIAKGLKQRGISLDAENPKPENILTVPLEGSVNLLKGSDKWGNRFVIHPRHIVGLRPCRAYEATIIKLSDGSVVVVEEDLESVQKTWIKALRGKL
jgi:hypothetical protein